MAGGDEDLARESLEEIIEIVEKYPKLFKRVLDPVLDSMMTLMSDRCASEPCRLVSVLNSHGVFCVYFFFLLALETQMMELASLLAKCLCVFARRRLCW